jgi:hypothetical protein
MDTFSMVVGNRFPHLTRVLMNSATNPPVPIDLSDVAGVEIEFFIGTNGETKTGECEFENDDTGVVTYEWALNDIYAAGICKVRFHLIREAGRQTVPSDGSYFEFPVSA